MVSTVLLSGNPALQNIPDSIEKLAEICPFKSWSGYEGFCLHINYTNGHLMTSGTMPVPVAHWGGICCYSPMSKVEGQIFLPFHKSHRGLIYHVYCCYHGYHNWILISCLCFTHVVGVACLQTILVGDRLMAHHCLPGSNHKNRCIAGKWLG